MRKRFYFQSGFFNRRVLLACTLCSIGMLLAIVGAAAKPASSAERAPNKSATASASVSRPIGRNTSSAPNTPGWSLAASPNTDAMHNDGLSAVACTSTSDCWTVGSQTSGGYSQTMIEHWNGKSWSIVTSPNTSSTRNNYLAGVTCVSSSDCWAVGSHGDDASNISQTLTLHWDGSAWSVVASPNTSLTQDTVFNDLRSVSCTSTADCWAVGQYFADSHTGLGYAQTLIERWDGISWTIVVSPNGGGVPNFLNDVTCISPLDCWAVGIRSAYSVATRSYVPQTLTERWDGVSWTIVTSPNINPTGDYGDNFLSGVICASESDCWAVGYSRDFPSTTLIQRWNGTSWAIVTSPNSGTSNNILYGITCTSTSDCWAVGAYLNNSGSGQTLFEHWDGSSWLAVSSPNTSSMQDNFLYRVTCTSGQQCWAVGDFRNDSGVDRTLIEDYSSTIPPLNGVVSTKIHGSTSFDIDLPLIGTPGIECRDGSDNGNYTIVFHFTNPVLTCGTTTCGGATCSASGGAGASDCSVSATAVPNAQYLTISLTDVVDSQGNIGNVSTTMGVLIGDVNGSGRVDAADVSFVRQQTLQPIDASNFRADINASGRIDAADVSVARQQTLTSLPAWP
jgi:hypothetical protein